MNILLSLLCMIFCWAFALANTEKVIFLGPSSVATPTVHPTFDDLDLEILTPSSSQVRRYLKVAFPTKLQEQGLESWYLLDGLLPKQRYEVRVCWAAIQPTQFWLSVFSISEVFDKPDLISGLASYSESRLARTQSAHSENRKQGKDIETALSRNRSILFLQVRAAADFFTTNETLMRDPPAVLVDLILDPYLFNIFPKSLLPTGVYITILAIGSWFLSGFIWRWLRDLARQQSKVHAE